MNEYHQDNIKKLIFDGLTFRDQLVTFSRKVIILFSLLMAAVEFLRNIFVTNGYSVTLIQLDSKKKSLANCIQTTRKANPLSLSFLS